MDDDVPAGRTAWFAVINATVEEGYPGDPMSLPREEIDVTVHSERGAAVERLLAELDADLRPEQARALRRSWLLRVDVPDAMGGASCPRRWMSDRRGELLRRVGAAPGEHAAAVARGAVAPLLRAELAAAVGALRDALSVGGEAAAVAAMQLAGASARAEARGAVGPALARRVAGVARAVGAAAWAGEEVSHLAPALEALEAEAPVDGAA